MWSSNDNNLGTVVPLAADCEVPWQDCLSSLFVKIGIRSQDKKPGNKFKMDSNSSADVIKVRLQMQLVGQKGPLTGMGNLFFRMLRDEGPKSFYLGLGPALTRSLLYGGMRLGLYEPSKYVCELAFGSTNILVKLASGAFAGSVATALTNPVEVLKVRLQVNPDSKDALGEMRKIYVEEGAMALWKGVGPAMARAAALTSSQLATYDESKRVRSSMVAGVVSTLMTAPIDTVKTRLMLQKESGGPGSYRNGFHCGYQIIRTEGPRALYKGLQPRLLLGAYSTQNAGVLQSNTSRQIGSKFKRHMF
ncbi:Mitochondrial substrate carrier family protein ucpB-like protein [Drosera capensis]